MCVCICEYIHENDSGISRRFGWVRCCAHQSQRPTPHNSISSKYSFLSIPQEYHITTRRQLHNWAYVWNYSIIGIVLARQSVMNIYGVAAPLAGHVPVIWLACFHLVGSELESRWDGWLRVGWGGEH